jgi:hypothetical protein
LWRYDEKGKTVDALWVELDRNFVEMLDAVAAWMEYHLEFTTLILTGEGNLVSQAAEHVMDVVGHKALK